MNDAPGTTVVTITTRNYFHRARVLMSSFAHLAPRLKCVVYCVDEFTGFINEIDENLKVIDCGSIGVPNFGKLRIALNPTALCCAMKPHVVLHAMRELNAEQVLYFDNDIGIYREPTELIEAVEQHPLVLTPHFLMPPPSGSKPNEYLLRPYGVYNAGIFAARNTNVTLDFMEWWACWIGRPAHVIEKWGYDQTWLDFAMVYCPGTFILRNAGYNVAYWNLAERNPGIEGDKIVCAEGVPLTAFHFSNLSEDRPEALNRNLSGWNQPISDSTRELARRIADEWLKAGRSTCNSWGYGFSCWQDGKPIMNSERNWFVENWDSIADVDFLNVRWRELPPVIRKALTKVRIISKLAKFLPTKFASKIRLLAHFYGVK